MKKLIAFITLTLIMLTVISCDLGVLIPGDSIPEGMGKVTVNLPTLNLKGANTVYTCMDKTTNYIITVSSPIGQLSEQISSSETSISFNLYPETYTITVLATNQYSSTDTDSYNFITGSGIKDIELEVGDSPTVNIAISPIKYDTKSKIFLNNTIKTTGNYYTGIPEVKFSGNLLAKITYTNEDDEKLSIEESIELGLEPNSTWENINSEFNLPGNMKEDSEIILDIYPESFEGTIDGVNLHDLHPTDRNYHFYPPQESLLGTFNSESNEMVTIGIGIFWIGDESNKDDYEEDDTSEDAKPLTLDEVQNHNFVDDPSDWYTVEVEEGYIYTFETAVSGTDTVMALYDSEMTQIDLDDDGGVGYASEIEYLFTTSGTFYLNITPYNNVTGIGTNYTIISTRTLPPQPVELPLPFDQKKWTILVYLDADNNLAYYGASDIVEMTGVGSTDDVNIVVLWDDMANNHGYYYIENGVATFAKELGEVNMGSETTATDFIDWAVDNFPADHYMLDYWNHGGAVDRSRNITPRGVAWDDTNGHDWLSETEQKNIIEFFYNKINRPIDIVSYDACLMATAEIAYMYKGYADYLVASEETEPGDGWDYTFLNAVTTNPDISGEELSQNVLTYYMDWYSFDNSVTFSVADLSHIDKFAVALDTFCSAAIGTGAENGSIFYSFTAGVADFSGYTKDLYGYLANVVNSDNPIVTTEIKEYASNIMTIISEDLIIFEDHGINWTNKAYGLSITMKADTEIYSLLDICQDTSWDEFLTFCNF